jgi:acetyl-CoA carboxylase beta subunit
MNGAKLIVDWKQAEPTDQFSPELRSESQPKSGRKLERYSRQIVATKSVSKCPSCESIIYSRKNKICGVCAEALPDELLFTADERERVEELIEREKMRHHWWRARMLRLV